MKPDRFDLLDHLHTIDADARWIQLDDLAQTLNSSTEATHKRMRRISEHGWVDIDRGERFDPIRYRVTGAGTTAYRAHLLRMDGVTGPPTPIDAIDLPSLLAHRIVTLGKEAA